jgi:hypothetical protein
VGGKSFCIKAGPGADQFESSLLRVFGQAHLPRKPGRHRAFDGSRLVVCTKDIVDETEALHVIGRQLHGHHSR